MNSLRDLYSAIWTRVTNEDATVPERLHAALRFLPEAGLLLDIGCGTGGLRRLLSNHHGRMVGLDITHTALKAGYDNGVEAVQADLNQPPFPFYPETFDGIVGLDVIEHVFDPGAFLQEIYRILRRGGHLILSTPNTRFVRHIADLVIRGRGPRTSYDQEGYDGGHLHYFTFRDIRDLLQTHGFQIEAEEGIAYRDYRSLKLCLFSCLARLWEREVRKEFFSLGVLVKARKV